VNPLSNVLRWLFALLVLSTATIAEAGVSPFWQSLGGSATGNGVSQTAAPKAVFEMSVAVGSDGRPVLTYVEYPNETASQGSIVVKRWTGTAWQTLSVTGTAVTSRATAAPAVISRGKWSPAMMRFSPSRESRSLGTD
jgi:hypothetical protein